MGVGYPWSLTGKKVIQTEHLGLGKVVVVGGGSTGGRSTKTSTQTFANTEEAQTLTSWRVWTRDLVWVSYTHTHKSLQKSPINPCIACHALREHTHGSGGPTTHTHTQK